MARTPKEGGLTAICSKHGITKDQLFDFLSPDFGERTFWDWQKTKPRGLEAIIMGVAQQLGTVALTDTEDCIHYTTRFEMEAFITQKIGQGWQISDDTVWDSDENCAFTIQRLGNNPTIVL